MPAEDLSELVRRRLWELGRTVEEASERSRRVLSAETITRIAHSGGSSFISEGVAEHLANALDVPENRVRRAAGLPLHDANGVHRELGGACLTPEAALGGLVVTWRQHDRMSVDQVHGAPTDSAVQEVMNNALADVLRVRGFAVDAFGGASGHVVRSLA